MLSPWVTTRLPYLDFQRIEFSPASPECVFPLGCVTMRGLSEINKSIVRATTLLTPLSFAKTVVQLKTVVEKKRELIAAMTP